jgi:serpin B
MEGLRVEATLRRVAVSRRRGGGLAGLALAATVVLGGCGSATATQVHLGPSAAPASAGPSATPVPTARPSLTPTPEPTPEPMAVPDWLKGDFDVAMGSAGPVTPADDLGSAAGLQINDFGLDLIRRLDARGNICLSPTSIAIALAMVRPGARGMTATEMDKVLHGFGSDGDASEVAALLGQLRGKDQYMSSDGYPLLPGDTPDPASPDPAVELNVPNAAFLQNGMHVEQNYLDVLAGEFGAGAGLLDFRTDPEAARLAINKWAADQTRGRIPEALGPGDVDDSIRIALANAVYMKAAWGHKFDPAMTKNRTFTTASGKRLSVPTMAAVENLGYVAAKGYVAVDVPYSGDFSMTIVMPTDMSAFLGTLTAAKLDAIVASESTHEVDLTLPRFSIDSRFELSDALSAMGMPTAFTPQADLSGITTDVPPLMLKKVVHEANIDVVEDGTTAAAVTVVFGATTGGGEPPEFPKAQVHVDRPFAYFIRDTMSGAVLFMGVVNDPSAK